MDKNPFQYNNLVAVSGDVTTAATSVGQVPWLALADRGAVIVRPPALTSINQNYTGPWWVCGPNGEQIDTTGTTTQGLQEAINYACRVGCPLYVRGNGGRSTSVTNDTSTYPPIFFCSQPIIFPAMFLMDIDLGDITIQYTGGSISTAAVIIQSCMMVRLRMNGQIVTNSNAAGLMLRPTGSIPIDGSSAVITSSRFEIGSVGSSAAGTATTQVIFDCVNGSIISNHITLGEVECKTGNIQTGVLVQKAGSLSGATVFAENEIHAPNIHGFSSVGFCLGGTTLAGTYYGNNHRGNLCFFSSLRGGGASAVGINCFGNKNVFHVGLINGEEGGLLNGTIISHVDIGTGTEGGNNNILICGGVKDNTGSPYIDGSGQNYANISGLEYSPSLTVAQLPTPSSDIKNTHYMVSDANATTFASIVAGGGANRIPVYCDGTNWRIG